MQVILLERVEKLGQMGQVVNVKAGYARNYLLPKKKALRATKQNISFFENKRVEFEANNLNRKSEAQVVADKMEGVMISLIRQASEMGNLYGSVRPADVAQCLGEAGFKVSRSQIQIETPIKFLGMYQVRVLLHPEISVYVKVNVAQSEEEAAVQAAGGKTTGEESSASPITEEAPAYKKNASPRKSTDSPKRTRAKKGDNANIDDEAPSEE
ncbi:MAG: 50S ribosomal protein L9 [Alphaproteobacteria bacterium]|nr:50S ribosomal protein L9 [Alphaproteobacteria bacterium]